MKSRYLSPASAERAGRAGSPLPAAARTGLRALPIGSGTGIKTVLLTVLVIAVYLLHQDFWNWKRATPLIFGFLPVGLAYHAGYSFLAAFTMFVLVKLAWPRHLEPVDDEQQNG